MGEVEALLTTVRVPVKFPGAVGEKTTVTIALAPGGIELRTVPLIEKLDPPGVMLALVIVMVAFPGLEISKVCDAVPPTVTSPKET